MEPRLITAGHIQRVLEHTAREAGVRLDEAGLKELNLSGLDATGLESGALAAFPQLRKLNLRGNKLSDIGAAFAAAPLLSWLQLGSNLLGQDSRHLRGLGPLVCLTTLTLSGNALKKISRSALKPLVKLKALILNDNALENLSFLPKSTLPSLNVLVLSDNAITAVTADELRRVPQLSKLSLSRNRIADFPALPPKSALVELRLAHNLLAAPPSDAAVSALTSAAAKSMRLLDLSGNAIEDWATWSTALKALQHLTSLSLRGNPIVFAGCNSGPHGVEATLKANAVKLFPTLRIFSGQSITSDLERQGATTISGHTRSATTEYQRKQRMRERNLVSTKLHKPDASKPRNKPCSCGSGLKYKLCCEKRRQNAGDIIAVDGSAAFGKMVEPAQAEQLKKRKSSKRERKRAAVNASSVGASDLTADSKPEHTRKPAITKSLAGCNDSKSTKQKGYDEGKRKNKATSEHIVATAAKTEGALQAPVAPIANPDGSEDVLLSGAKSSEVSTAKHPRRGGSASYSAESGVVAVQVRAPRKKSAKRKREGDHVVLLPPGAKGDMAGQATPMASGIAALFRNESCSVGLGGSRGQSGWD